jgi:RsiW-degrading membrane proteinase PrsW (M82 family)
MTSALYQNAAALSGLVVWYGVFVLLERHDRWCWFRPLLPLLAGCLSFRALGWYLGAIHPIIVPHLEHLAGGRRLVLFIHDVGLREEAVKLLFALPCMLWLKSRPAPQSALTAAAMVGLGFATAENRWFFGGHAEPTLLVGRVFSTTALHVASTGLCGAALSQAWQSRPQAWSRFLAVFLAVVVAHGLYDWAPGGAWLWLRAGGTSWLSQVVVITLLAWFFGLYHRTLPMRSPLCAALNWFAISATTQYALALGLTWARWQTLEAVWICARECLLFLPVVLCTALLLHSQLRPRFVRK